MDRARRQFGLIVIVCSLWPVGLVAREMVHWLTAGAAKAPGGSWLARVHYWTRAGDGVDSPSASWLIVRDLLQSFQAVLLLLFGIALLIGRRRWWLRLSPRVSIVDPAAVADGAPAISPASYGVGF